MRPLSASNGVAAPVGQAFVFRTLLLYRWLALLVPAVALLSAPSPNTSWLLFGLAILDNLLPTIFTRQLNALVLKVPALFAVDFAVAAVLLSSSGGVLSPYYLYALSPTLACAFFFGIRGGLLAALAFAPLHAIAAGVSRVGLGPDQLTLLLTQLIALGAAATAFGFLAETMARLRTSAGDLRRLHDDLLTKNAHLERSNQELQAMQDLALAIRDASAVENVQERLLSILTDQLGFERAVVGLVEPGGRFVSGWLASGSGLDLPALPHTVSASLDGTTSGVGRALATRKTHHASPDELPPLGVPTLDTAVWQREYAAVPMICRDHPVGAILVDNPRSGRPIRAETLEGLGRLANQAALALANVQMCVERAQRTAVTGERQRIASEMHDAVIQSLFGIAVNLEGCMGLLERDPDQVRDRLTDLRGMALDLLGELRGTLYDLWAGEFDGAALVAALTRHGEEIRRLTGVDIQVRVEGDPAVLGEVGAKTLYRIAQEALSNATRHSAARAATVELAFGDRSASLQVADAGIGFDPRAVCAGLGLRTMQERAASVGGALEILARPGAGTQVRATVQCCQIA